MKKNNDLIRFQKIIDPCVAIILFKFIVISNSINYEYISNQNIIYVCIALLIIFIFPKGRLYESYRTKKIIPLFMKISTSWLMVLAGVQFILSSFSSGVFTYDSKFLSWSLSCYLIYLICHLVGRKIIRVYNKIYRKNIRILYWGSFDAVTRFKKNLDNCYVDNFELKAWFCPEQIKKETTNFGHLPYFEGGLDELDCWIRNNKIDFLVFSHEKDHKYSLQELINFFGDKLIKSYLDPLWPKPTMNIKITEISENICFSLWDRTDSLIDALTKRIFDIIFSIMAIILLSPIFLLVSFLIKIDSNGPILFRQIRYGINGKKFKIFKFRTMYQIEDDNKFLIQTKKEDPRVTRFGKVMRKWSIDELPQLFNVLIGQMSVVGPRPHVTSHNEYYRKRISGYTQRSYLKPGITGLAQVNGFRGETSRIVDMENRITFDLKYQKNWSIWIDIKIILLTILKIKSKNAF